MVQMSMGHQNMADFLIPEPGQQCRNMVRQIRPRIDHRDLARADNISVGPEKGVRARIIGHDAPHVGRHLFGDAIVDVLATIDS